MPLLVRRAGRRDLGAIQSLWLRLREEQGKADPRLALGPNAARLEAEHREIVLADRRTAFFVAEDQGEVIAFLHAQIDPNDPAYTPERYGTIVDLFVASARRGQGIGSQLLEFCKDWLRASNVSEYRLSTPANSETARRFFERRGAAPLRVVQVASLSESEAEDEQ